MRFEADTLSRYISLLAKSWFVWVTGILDLLAFLVGFFFGDWRTPSWVYIVVTAIGFTAANVHIFAESQKREEDLRRELERVRVRRPHLQPAWILPSGEHRQEWQIVVESGPLPYFDFDGAVKAKIAELKAVSRRPRNPLVLPLEQLNPDYDSEVASYGDTYRNRLKMKLEFEHQYDRLSSVAFGLHNLGHGPATHITLRVTLSEEVDFAGDRRGLWDYWDETGEFGFGEPQLYRSVLYVFPNFSRYVGSPTQPDPFDAELESGHAEKCIIYRVDSLAPGAKEDRFEPVTLWFGNARVDQTLIFRTTITADELTEPVVGQLALTVRGKDRR